MAQYYPTHEAHKFTEINRRITAQEYRRALDELERYGLVEGFRQTMDTLVREIVPEWTDELRDS
jgi:hypothetical protein